MNNERRSRIKGVSDQLDAIREKIQEVYSEIESIRDEEQEYFDNMPESIQQGEKGSHTEEVIQHLDYALDACEFDVETIVTELESAAE